MGKKQNESKKANDIKFLVLISVIIFFLFLLLVPKVSSTLFAPKRQAILKSFVSNVKEANTVGSQKFWEFREFYSPGSFYFDKNGLSEDQIGLASERIKIPINTEFIDRFFLTFTAPHLVSLEAFTTTTDLTRVININDLDRKEEIFLDKSSLIYKDSRDITHVIFLKPISEMERANGFFDYDDVDKDFVKDKYWLEITTLDEN